MSSINYDLKKIKAIIFDIDGVLSPSTIPTDSDGNPVRMVNIKDGYALQLAVRHQLKIAIITGGKSEAMRHRYEALGIKDIFQNASEKLPVMKKWIADNSLQKENVAYMGDDIPDIPCMEKVGLPCAPFDAAPEVRTCAKYISRINGGYGCARDILEQIMKARGMWLDKEKAFGW